MKTAFWKADWFLGLVIAIALFGYARVSGFIPGIERWAYDVGVKMTSKNPSDKIAVIAIDDQSIANIGRWPWPREVQAKLQSLKSSILAAERQVLASASQLQEARVKEAQANRAVANTVATVGRAVVNGELDDE